MHNKSISLFVHHLPYPHTAYLYHLLLFTIFGSYKLQLIIVKVSDFITRDLMNTIWGILVCNSLACKMRRQKEARKKEEGSILNNILEGKKLEQGFVYETWHELIFWNKVSEFLCCLLTLLILNYNLPYSTFHFPLSTFHSPLSTFHSPLSSFLFPLSTFEIM